MKVGFLSIEKRTVDPREARIALFDGGHTCGPFVFVDDATDVSKFVDRLSADCDAIVVEGNTSAFYDLYKDKFPTHPESLVLNDRLFCVTSAATENYLYDGFVPYAYKYASSKGKKTKYQSIVFKTYGKTEDELKALLKDYLKARSKIQLGFFPDFLEVEVHARGPVNMPQADFSSAMDNINQLLYKCTYSMQRVSIAERVAQMLRAQRLKLKIAESFTGGALAREFTSVPGASEYLVEGLVTYSVASKIKRLKIPAEAIAENGVVSSDTAYRMAVGLLSDGDCDIAISTTGNAGPTSAMGPVGLCYVAIGNRSEVHTVRYSFDGDREENIKTGVKKALFLLFEYLANREAIEQARNERAGAPN